MTTVPALSPRKPLFRTIVVVFGCLWAAYLLFTLSLRSETGWFATANDILLLLVNAMATGVLIYAAVRSRAHGQASFWAWSVLAAAQLAYVLGDAIWAILQSTLAEPPYPSIADAFYLAYYPLFVIGLFLLPMVRLSKDEWVKMALDLAIVMLSAGLLCWNFLIAPTIVAGPVDLLELSLSVAYPVLDLVLFFTLFALLFRQAQQPDPWPLILLEIGVALTISADSVFIVQNLQGTFSAGGLSDHFYVVGYLVTALAGLRVGLQTNQPSAQPAPDQQQHTWVSYITYLWGMAAFLVLADYERIATLPFSVLALMVGAIFALIILRQIIALQENLRLYRGELERRRLAEALGQAGRDLASTLDVQVIPGLILDQLARVIPYERGSIMLERGGQLYFAVQRGFPEDERSRTLSIAISQKDDVFVQMSQTHQPVIVADVTKVTGWQIIPWLPLNQSWMGVPLVARGRTIGMFSVTRQLPGAFSPNDALLASAFSSQAAISLENARLYGELNQAYRTLEVLDSTKTKFIDIVAHELRTPLTVIRGYSQVLKGHEEVQKNEQFQTLLEGILNGMGRMNELVNNMLDVARIDSNVLKLYKKPFAMDTLMLEVTSPFEEALVERALALSVGGLDGLPPVEVDDEMLIKAFKQLLMNAIKYTPDGGQISIRGAVNESQGMVELVFSDTGIGVARDQQQAIFEKFYQTGDVSLHSSGRTRFKAGGPGLGLAIARGIVLAHGGQIWVESSGYDEQTCPGSQFHVQLPLSA
jgi:signal transduction histidine kinase